MFCSANCSIALKGLVEKTKIAGIPAWTVFLRGQPPIVYGTMLLDFSSAAGLRKQRLHSLC